MGGSIMLCGEDTTYILNESIANKFRHIYDFNIFGFEIIKIKSSENIFSINIQGKHYWNSINTICGITMDEDFISLKELEYAYEEYQKLIEKIVTNKLCEFSCEKIDYIIENLNLDRINQIDIDNLIKYNAIVDNYESTITNIKEYPPIGFNEILGFADLFKICHENNIVIRII